MNEYGELDQYLRVLHIRLHLADDSTGLVKLEALAEEEARVCDRMREIEDTDHAQVERYRTSRGWQPCWQCQDATAAAEGRP